MKSETQENIVPGLAGVVLRAWKRRGTAREPRALRVVETIALSGRARLHVVDCGGERFLVGGGADSVQCIVPVGAGQQGIAVVGE